LVTLYICYNARMNNYALLTLLRGNGNYMGLPEIRFHYPPRVGREQELFIKAIQTLQQYSFMQRVYWALVEDSNFDRFKEFLQTQIPGSELVIIPVDIMHGEIGFKTCLQLNGFQQSDKEQLLDTIMQADVSPHKDTMDYFSGISTREKEALGWPVTPEEIKAEKKAAFAKNLSFY